jgi:hypothetical protein
MYQSRGEMIVATSMWLNRYNRVRSRDVGNIFWMSLSFFILHSSALNSQRQHPADFPMSQPTTPPAGHTVTTPGVPNTGPGDCATKDNDVAIPGDDAVKDERVRDDATRSGNEQGMSPTVPAHLPGAFTTSLPDHVADVQCLPAQLALHAYIMREPLEVTPLNLDEANAWLEVNPVSSVSLNCC